MTVFVRAAIAGSLGLLASAAHAQMASADRNGDGVVTREEQAAQAEARFKRIDHNKNGVIDPEEIAMVKRFMNARAPKAVAALETLAADGGGKITHEAFMAASKASFDRADTNHDGILDKAEQAAAKDGQ